MAIEPIALSFTFVAYFLMKDLLCEDGLFVYSDALLNVEKVVVVNLSNLISTERLLSAAVREH